VYDDYISVDCHREYILTDETPDNYIDAQKKLVLLNVKYLPPGPN
jgi:hypothetical protein